MKQIEAAILGYGDRSSRYAEYSVSAPNELKIIAVIDINPLKLSLAKDKFSLNDDMLFTSLDVFLKKNIKCDIVINGTMDEMHYQTTMALLEHKYNVLLEKPVTANKRELLEIQAKAQENDCKVLVCHVLRYTPFYSQIKSIVDDGKIGEIINMQLNEHVWLGHFVNAYVRGKWRSEKECGSGLLLAKCCHDTDLICWLNNNAKPAYVSSFGSKSYFTRANAPQNSTEYCFNCPNKSQCMFDAEKFELEADFIPFYTWAGINKPIESITKKEKIEFLKHDTYGKCVFKTDMDVVDRQCVSVEFDNGSTATLNMVGGTSKAGRHIHIVGTKGEILGYIEQNKFTLRIFDQNKLCSVDTEIDCGVVSDEKDNSIAGHYGGDYYIMRDLIRFLNGAQTSSSTTVLNDSINGHLLVYCAEESRKTHKTIDFNILANA